MKRIKNLKLASIASAALISVFASSVGIAKSQMPERAPAPLSKAEVDAGLRVANSNPSYAMKVAFPFTCSPDKSKQFVVPLFLGYDRAAAEKAGLPPERRVLQLQLAERTTASILTRMAATPTGLKGLLAGEADSFLAERVREYEAGVEKSAGLAFNIMTHFPVVFAEGCGTIKTIADYNAAAKKADEQQQEDERKTKRGPSYDIRYN